MGTNFIGFDKIGDVAFQTKRGEATRCNFCSNRCVRTFVDLKVKEISKRYIIATCEKGEAETKEELKKVLNRLKNLKKTAPNFVEISNKEAFKSYYPLVISKGRFSNFFKKEKIALLKDAVIGIPKVLNLYTTAPFFRAYFETLGVKKVVFSDFTSDELYKKGAKRGAIDPCFPSKVAIAHIDNLLHKKNVNFIFFPCIKTLKGEIYKAFGHWTCPTVAATPEVVKSAFTMEKDDFAEVGVTYLNPVLNMAEWDILERELHQFSNNLFGITKQENQEAMKIALEVWNDYFESLRQKGAKALENLEIRKEIGIVLLGREYHNDQGINHGILDELNKLGYTIFTINSLPRDTKTLKRLFKEDMEKGVIEDPFDIRDVWPKCYSENSSMKVWGAKYVARHPNLVAIDLSSFRCGHDAPIYAAIEELLEKVNTPYFTFHEIDENRPSGSIKIRVETIDYFLKKYKAEVL